MPPTRVFPVIHLSTLPQALANARLTQAHGCAGIFLIHMDGRDAMIPEAAQVIREHLPDLFIGANYLSLGANEALEQALSDDLDATWSDSPGVRSDGVSMGALGMARRLGELPDHTFFGSVAFKYQPVDPDPGAAAAKALELGMLPTTSGTATGSAPSLEKLAAIREVIGPDARLAVASGVDAANIAGIARFATDILVSTGIGADFYTFDEGKLAELMAMLAAGRHSHQR